VRWLLQGRRLLACGLRRTAGRPQGTDSEYEVEVVEKKQHDLLRRDIDKLLNRGPAALGGNTPPRRGGALGSVRRIGRGHRGA